MTDCIHIRELGNDVFKSANISGGDPLDLTDGKPNYTIPKSIFEYHDKRHKIFEMTEQVITTNHFDSF